MHKSVSRYLSNVLIVVAASLLAAICVPAALVKAQMTYGNTFPFWNVTGPLTVGGTSTLTGGIIGTATNDGAVAGLIGELKSSTVATASAISLSSATATNITSVSLTPGDWDVSAACTRNLSGVTATVYSCSISPTSATMSTQAGGSGIGTDPLTQQSATFGTTITGNYSQAIPPVRVSLSEAATSIYLVNKDTFSAGTLSAYGTLRARRIR